MHHLKAALAALLIIAAPAAALADDPVPTLSANGEGSVAVVPDIAIVTIGVTARAPTAREALDRNSADLDSVIASLRAAGIADRDIGTTGFSVSPVYEQRPPRNDGTIDDTPPAIVGYQVTNQVRVTIRNIDQSGAVLDQVVSAGANQVNGIAFDISDPESAAAEALAAAVKDATRQAEIMAEAAGVKLVRILSVSGGGSRPGPLYRADAMVARAVPVMPGESQVTANANVSWEIAPR